MLGYPLRDERRYESPGAVKRRGKDRNALSCIHVLQDIFVLPRVSVVLFYEYARVFPMFNAIPSARLMLS